MKKETRISDGEIKATIETIETVPEEREQLKKEVTAFVTDSVKDVTSGTFTKEHFK